MNTPKPLAQWLQHVMDDLKIHDRTRWAALLGVSRQAVGQWLNGRDLPSADKLELLLTVLQENYIGKVEQELVDWHRIASMPLQEVWPGARTPAKTIAHYLAQHALGELATVLSCLPPDVQREVCIRTMYDCTELRLRDQRSDLDSHLEKRNVSPIEKRLEETVPAAVEAYGLSSLVAMQRSVAEEPSSWGRFRLIPQNRNAA